MGMSIRMRMNIRIRLRLRLSIKLRMRKRGRIRLSMRSGEGISEMIKRTSRNIEIGKMGFVKKEEKAMR